MFSSSKVELFPNASCCRTAVADGQRGSLSFRLHKAGDPLPTPGPGEGDVTTGQQIGKEYFMVIRTHLAEYICSLSVHHFYF